nr:putative ribonuclease H-like domain-containing protein [Tanacetum cinerariifolium]
DIQKSVSPDTHSSSSGAQTRKQGDKIENKDKVSTAGHNFINITNDFSAVGPSNAAMPNLENITHSDDADDVGAEADINNLESIISEEGINYEEVFGSVARIEAIRLFLAYASFMGFLVYQMDVKSAFLYGTIEEEVYICQPPGFKDLENPDKVYKVVKALYGLHQALRA